MSFFSCWKSLYYLRRHCHYTVIFCYIHVHLEATKWSKNTPIHYTLNIYVVFSWKLRIHLHRSCPADDRCPCCELSQESTDHAMYIDLSTIMFILPLKPFMLPRKLEICFWCTGWTCAVQSRILIKWIEKMNARMCHQVNFQLYFSHLSISLWIGWDSCGGWYRNNEAYPKLK